MSSGTDCTDFLHMRALQVISYHAPAIGRRRVVGAAHGGLDNEPWRAVETRMHRQSAAARVVNNYTNLGREKSLYVVVCKNALQT